MKVVNLFGLLAALIPVGAEAELIEKVDVRWNVQPATDAGAEIEVKVGEVVSRTVLFPSALAILDDDVVGQNGFPIAPKGEKLYERPARGRMAYCAMSSRKSSRAGLGEPNSAATDPCFMDTDGDQAFDDSFRIDTYNAMIFGKAMVSKRDVPIKPAKFHFANPADVGQSIYVGVKYVARPIYNSQPVFAIGFGGLELTTTEGFGLTPIGVTPRDGALEIFGARYRILSDDGNRLKLRVERAIPAQPFSVRHNI